MWRLCGCCVEGKYEEGDLIRNHLGRFSMSMQNGSSALFPFLHQELGIHAGGLRLRFFGGGLAVAR